MLVAELFNILCSETNPQYGAFSGCPIVQRPRSVPETAIEYQQWLRFTAL